MSQPTTGIFFNSTDPAAPAGNQNVVPQSDADPVDQSVTFYPQMATDTLLGVVRPDTTSIVIDPATGELSAIVSDVDISFSDNTTGDVSTVQHGFAPKAPNDATQYLDGTGAWSVPAGGGGGGGGPLLQVDGVDNGDQSELNLKSGAGISVVDDGAGGVEISAVGVADLISVNGVALPTGALAGNSYTGTVTLSAPGTTPTSGITATFNGDMSAVNGWGSVGGLVLRMWPGVDVIYYRVFNQTTASITPGAASVNFRVIPDTPSGGGSSLSAETPSGAQNSVNQNFTVANAPRFVTLNGVVQDASSRITITGLSILFAVAPRSYDVIRSWY